jgi:hypothetical protein
MTLDKNHLYHYWAEPSYLLDTLVSIGKENPSLLAPTSTSLLPSHLTSRRPKEREEVQRNFSEGVQEHGEGDHHRGRTGNYRRTVQLKGAKTEVIPNAWHKTPVRKTIRLGPHERTKCVRCNATSQHTRHARTRMLRSIVFFYFYNGRHKVRYNGRILCARVAPAL